MFDTTTKRFWRHLLQTACVACGLLSYAASTPAAQTDLEREVVFSIAAQPLESALLHFSRQAGVQLLTSSAEIPVMDSAEVSGRYGVRAALIALLQGTGLKFSIVREGTIAISSKDSPGSAHLSSEGDPDLRLVMQRTHASATGEGNASIADEGTGKSSSPSEEGDAHSAKGIPEILVQGSRILNMDIARSREDAQPYVILGRQAIEQSGAATLETFLKNRLPMSTNGFTQNGGDTAPNVSQINLRGLGTTQTLILVDGRRLANRNSSGFPGQPDINGIPLSAVERIEILPTTASGIYGGSATGGVINIILRRDYSGAEVSATYEDSFAGGGASRRVDLNGGFSLEEGRTSVIVTGSFSDKENVLMRDRDLQQRGLARILNNNPAFFLNSTTPPLGYTTNIRSNDGTNLRLDNGTLLNSPITYVPVGYAGALATGDGGAAFVANAGRYNFDLADSVLQAGGVGGRSAIVSGPTAKSAGISVRRRFSDTFQGFIDGSWSNGVSRNPVSFFSSRFVVSASAPNNPFAQDVVVTAPLPTGSDQISFSENTDQKLLGGIIVKLPRGWHAEADYTWNTSELRFRLPTLNSMPQSAAATPLVANGTLDVLSDMNTRPTDFSPYIQGISYFFLRTPFHSEMNDAVARASGPMMRLPAGPVVLSSLVERRVEKFDSAVASFMGTDIIYPNRSQSVDSAYLEAQVPFFSAAHARRGLLELELQVAVRHDRYETSGVTNNIPVSSPTAPIRATNKVVSTDPTLGLRYRPVEDVLLRASYGTGFLPPSVAQVTPSSPGPLSSSATLGSDPRRGGEPLAGPTTLILNGGNPNLQPEDSRSWSFGAVFTPQWLSGLRLSVDYTRMSKTNNIGTIPNSYQGLLDNEATFPGRVVRAAPLPGDPYAVGRVTFMDLTLLNLARTELEFYDAQLDYALEAGTLGKFEFFALSTWQMHYQTQTVSSSPLVENVGIGTQFPLKLRANAGVTWSRGAWQAGVAGRYLDSYFAIDPRVSTSATVLLNQGNGGKVDAQAFFDIFGAYDFGRDATSGPWLLRDTQLRAGINNVFNRDPSFDANGSFIGYYSSFGEREGARYYLTIKRSF